MAAPRYATPIVCAAAGLIGGFIVGTLWQQRSSIADADSRQFRQNEGQYTNPLLECDVAAGAINAQKENFSGPLHDFVEQTIRTNNLGDVAVYYRDLNNGPTFGVNENDPFIPASLLKVPVMMSYYKYAETDPSILKTQLTFSKADATGDIDQSIPPAEQLTVGRSYSIEDLIEHMITYSDNKALIPLARTMPVENQAHLYALLGVDQNVITDPSAALSVKQYSAFFRILFNASYLSQPYSEKALGLLAQTHFDTGMRAGVPQPVPVAHKFGERLIDGQQQLHDCGIVYYPKHPYLLCIMTRGADVPTLEKAVASISSFVYQKIATEYPLN